MIVVHGTSFQKITIEIKIRSYNLRLPYRYTYTTYVAWALQFHDLSGEDFKPFITYILFWPHKNIEGLLGRKINLRQGLRDNITFRQFTAFTYTIIQTRWNDASWLWRPDGIRQLLGPKVSWHFCYIYLHIYCEFFKIKFV